VRIGLNALDVDDRRLYEGGQISLGPTETCQHGPITVRGGQPKGGVANLNLRVLKVEFPLSPPNHHDHDQRADE
jgi:hypothetical protein